MLYGSILLFFFLHSFAYLEVCEVNCEMNAVHLILRTEKSEGRFTKNIDVEMQGIEKCVLQDKLSCVILFILMVV